MDFTLEVVVLPVSDVDRSLAFYTDQVGFALDVDYQPSSEFRVVQLTPAGSSCSIQFGVGLTTAPPGTAQNLCLVVTDLDAARRQLLDRGVEVGPIGHKTPFDTWQGARAAGLDPGRRDYASFADFSDPDGNTWVLQERGHTLT